MAQALFLTAVYALFVVLDVHKVKREKSEKKTVVLYAVLLLFCLAVTVLFFLNVDLPDPQSAIVKLIKGMGMS